VTLLGGGFCAARRSAQTGLATARTAVARAHAQSLINAAALAFATGELTSSTDFRRRDAAFANPRKADLLNRPPSERARFVGLLAGQYLHRGKSRARFGSFQREFTEARPGLSGTPEDGWIEPGHDGKANLAFASECQFRPLAI
jgi:hypothetical protein